MSTIRPSHSPSFKKSSTCASYTHTMPCFPIADDDPLFKMNSYTSYLASKRGDAEVIWSRIYEDEFGLGQVVTAAKPIYSPNTTTTAAFDEEGTLVGVVGHDVRLTDFEALVPEFLVAIRRFILRGIQCIDTVFTGCELQVRHDSACILSWFQSCSLTEFSRWRWGWLHSLTLWHCPALIHARPILARKQKCWGFGLVNGLNKWPESESEPNRSSAEFGKRLCVLCLSSSDDSVSGTHSLWLHAQGSQLVWRASSFFVNLWKLRQLIGVGNIGAIINHTLYLVANKVLQIVCCK